MHKLIFITLIVSMSSIFAFNPRIAMPKKVINSPIMIETVNENSSSKWYTGQSNQFDYSENGYGWSLGYNRKIQIDDIGPSWANFGSIYRQYNELYGTGVIGGMVGRDSDFNTNTLYESSLYQTEGTLPGGRYPYTCEYINGYIFTIFNDFDTTSEIHFITERPSQPMFTVCDATISWDLPLWTNPKRVESSDSSNVVPIAWFGTGDVAYDTVSGYYYWAQAWREEGLNLLDTSIISCVIGRTQTPADENSWEWTNYNDLRFDAKYNTKTTVHDAIGDFFFSYAKDVNGNGTGKGVGVAMTRNADQTNPKLSYIYTSNWGAALMDSSDFQPQWYTDSGSMYQIPMDELFHWYGDTLTCNDSIANNIVEGKAFNDTTVVIDDPFISWNISAVTTELNIVHVLVKAFPASSRYPGLIFPWTDGGFVAGYYDITGEITDTGVNWQPATFIANFVDNDKGWEVDDNGMEWKYSDRNTLSLCYTGNESFIAAWLDKPDSRPVTNPWSMDTHSNYIDDGYIIYSWRGSWIPDYSIDIETGIPEDSIWTLKYAGNATNTQTSHEDGWSIASRGYSHPTYAYTYAACQYQDPTNPPFQGDLFWDYGQFLRYWKVEYITSGIEAQEVSLVKDFELLQNYPNPFNPNTSIRFILQNNSKVKLSVYNSKGELVSNLKDEKMGKGSYSVNFNAEKLNSGIYFYTLHVNDRTETKKMVLIK